MLYEIEQAVFERFPGYARMAVVAEGVDNTREIPELAELLAQCEEGVRRDDLEDFWHVPVLETWAEAFSGMGIKPKKNPPSVSSSAAVRGNLFRSSIRWWRSSTASA